ncbi:MAG TPA: hypothetical protein PK397_13665 [Ignavibacteriaceae bacterium]|jgi:predicted extracellular nuclease|nr:hypothetical protein [Ignavibacteriaceae bacterium]
MKNRIVLLPVIIIALLSVAGIAQEKNDTLVIAFYNLENLFDTVDDPLINDEEWLPESEKKWDEEKLNKKMFNLSRVNRAMNNNNGPDILGVCESENEGVIKEMVNKFMPDLNYEVAYKESPDNRGIDVGLVYRSEKFSLLNVSGDTVHLPDNYPTRLVLRVDLLNKMSNDTLFVFVNHWPSRRGGEEKSEKNRVAAAATLRKNVEGIFENYCNANVIIMGDFNDEPANISISEVLKALPYDCETANELNEKSLYNLAFAAKMRGEGSYKYRDQWNMLDQIIVSNSIIKSENNHYLCNSFEVYKPEFIQTRSGKYEGAPFPTFGGASYLKGYSDHYPVIAKIIINLNSRIDE